MGRPPVIPAERKTRIVLSVLAGEMAMAEAARREKVNEQSIGRWKTDFLEAGKTGRTVYFAIGSSTSTTRCRRARGVRWSASRRPGNSGGRSRSASSAWPGRTA